MSIGNANERLTGMQAQILQNALREDTCNMDFLVVRQHRHWRDNWRLLLVIG
jgi:hypothetical protein